VRMLIACQLRLSTSTIVLFKMTFIKCLHMATAIRAVRCLFLLNLNRLPLLVTLQLFLFQRQVCRLPHSAAKWSLGKVLPLRFLGVGQT